MDRSGELRAQKWKRSETERGFSEENVTKSDAAPRNFDAIPLRLREFPLRFVSCAKDMCVTLYAERRVGEKWNIPDLENGNVLLRALFIAKDDGWIRVRYTGSVPWLTYE